MRREEYEFQVTRPQVIMREIDGQLMEPYEELSVDVDEQFQGVVIEKLGKLKAMLRAGEIDTDTYEKLLLEI